MTRAGAAITVVAVAAAGFALACAGSSARQTSAFQPSDSKKEEILALWTQIRDWRVDIGLPPAPSHSLQMSVWSKPLANIRRVCDEQSDPPDACVDTCNIADAICENAEDICRISDELGGDSWARDKCASAKASCKEAKEQCCDCCNEHAGEMPREKAAPARADEAIEGRETDAVTP